ncbi:hypothetical protein ACHHYP_06455 [Achlya hypogyna]|uniref:Transmembrane protein n=1 Tax=Achlya hypogyna TaxID=1202772 RepID=A0A1V9YU70_ACHHY|nr:hypothetical protein ACHHYP_06455 [Achlya hypogyna]
MALNGTYRWSSQTTYKMYWSLANDLMAVGRNTSGIGCRSLVRSSAEYAFANTTLAAVMIANGTLASPLSNGLQLVSITLGPFGVVDTVFVNIPAALGKLVADIVREARAGMRTWPFDAQPAYFAIQPVAITYPVPPEWINGNLQGYGGSPLCAELAAPKSVRTGLVSIVDFDHPCIASSPVQAKVSPVRQTLIVAAVASGLATSTKPVNTALVCSFDPGNINVCPRYMNATLKYIKTYMPAVNASFGARAATVHASIQSMNISFMLYTKIGGTLSLQHTPILSADDFAFFGWTYLYDWVVGTREVVEFVGDNGHLTLLTDEALPLRQQVQAWQVTGNFAQYSRVAVYYVTCVMLLVATVATAFMLRTHGCFEGRNLLFLDRVGGIVWVGRPLLFLRSLTAICLLSTASLDLQFSGYVTYFLRVPTPFYKIILASWEVAWLLAVIDDMFLVVTREHSRLYLGINSALLCLVAALISFTAPIAPTLTVNKTCSFIQMDFQVACRSAELVIGQRSRVLLLSGLTVAFKVVSYCVVRGVVGPLPPTTATSNLLSAGAKYMYTHAHRVEHGVYFLDRASAVLNGILTYRSGDVYYALDVKLWRLFSVPIPPGTSDALSSSLPLPDTCESGRSAIPH